MRASVIGASIVSCALAFSLSVAAQEKKEGEKKAPKEHTMTGCLQKAQTGEGFVVQNTAEKGPKVIGILESKDKLDPHVGHKIDITGVAVPVKDAESMKPAPAKADHYMKLSAIKMVSTTCP